MEPVTVAEMSSSDSEGGDQLVQPVRPALSDRMGHAPVGMVEASRWPQGGVSTYRNTLFKDGAGRNLQTQKSATAARRAQRMQGSLYTSNDGGMMQARPGSAIGRGGEAWGDEASQGGPRAGGGGIGRGVGDDVYGLKASYDPNEGQQQQQQLRAQPPQQPQQPRQLQHSSSLPARPGQAAAPPANPLMSMPPLTDIRAFLMAPGPRQGPIQCMIKREKQGISGSTSRYMLILEDGQRFLMAARKRKTKATSNYLVSLDMQMNRDSDAFFGKLRSNFVGSDFTIFDDGDKPGSSSRRRDDEMDDDKGRRELGCITYQYNVLGTRGPRKMTVGLPVTAAMGGNVRPWAANESLLDKVKRDGGFNSPDLVVMHNKTPRWNEELNAYCLNFHGRVTEASVKNFQLVTERDPNHIILQFGKTGSHSFSMDYQYPMSALQAFCVCLSSFDNKLACE